MLVRWARGPDPVADDAEAVVTTTESVSHGDLRLRVDLLRRNLDGSIGPLDRVAVCLDDQLQLLVVLLALTTSRATTMLLPADQTDAELGNILRHERPSTLLCDPDRAGIAANGRDATRIQDMTATTLTNGRQQHDDDPPMVCTYTSGTEGQPKAVMRSDTNLIAEGNGVASVLDLGPHSSVLCPVPLWHAYGLGVAVMGSLTSGAKLVLERPLSGRLLRQCVLRHEVRVLVGVPALYKLWSQGVEEEEVGAGLLNKCLSATAPLTQTVRFAFKKAFGRTVHQHYGMSECGSISVDLSEDGGPGCVGTPYPGVRVSIDSSATDSEDSIGEVVVESPYSGPGYRLGSSYVPFPADGIRTGDIGRLDPRGRLHLLGRVKDQINVRGQKVDPAQIQTVVEACPEVYEAVVLGVERSDGDQWVAAFVSCAPQTTEAYLTEWCLARLAPFKVPRRFVPVERIPVNSTGKVRRNDLLALLIDSAESGDDN